MKKKLLRALTLAQLRQFIGNNRTIRRFAERHSLVYFGTVTVDDDSRLVKGHTVSRTHRDQHYCVGTAFGRDMVFLQRSDLLYSSTHKHKERYDWNILALDLSERVALPHAYIEGKNRHGHAFYEALDMKHRDLAEIPTHLLVGYDPLFAQKFTPRTSLAHAIELPGTLTPLIAATLAHHFSMFDYEWHDDMLYIYYLSSRPTLDRLDHMLKCGVWLAGELENSQQPRENR